jgi:hypothetical protein
MWQTAAPTPWPPPPPSQDNEDEGYRCWDSNDEQELEDCEYEPPSTMAHYPGSGNQLVSFL